MNNNSNLSDLVGDSKAFIFSNENPLTIYKKTIIGYFSTENFDQDYGTSKIFLLFEKREDLTLWYRKKNPSKEGGVEAYHIDMNMLQKHFED